MNRRDFLDAAAQQLAAVAVAPSVIRVPRRATSSAAVDRPARLARHAPVVTRFDAFSALSVGNGAFAFTVDATGLQTFAEEYREIPLATQAEWGWHSFPNPARYSLQDALVTYDAHGRAVSYASAQDSAAGKWLRENPHRLSLGRVGFKLVRADDSPAKSSDLADVRQRLDLWSGKIESTFTLDGRVVRVVTAAHPSRDLIAVRVESAQLDPARLAIAIAFPYGGAMHTGDPADWSHADRHRTEIAASDRRSVTWHRTVDADQYWARASWTSGAKFHQTGPHEFLIEPSKNSASLECVFDFSPRHDREPL